MLFVVLGESGIGGCEIGDVRIERRHGRQSKAFLLSRSQACPQRVLALSVIVAAARQTRLGITLERWPPNDSGTP
jgi:hypothetical protein